MPLLLSIAFNLINVAYFWFVLLSLSAASRQGVQFASQGGPAASTISAPTTAAVSDLVYANVTNAIKGADDLHRGRAGLFERQRGEPGKRRRAV
jgi:hypothetical protein